MALVAFLLGRGMTALRQTPIPLLGRGLNERLGVEKEGEGGETEWR